MVVEGHVCQAQIKGNNCQKSCKKTEDIDEQNDDEDGGSDDDEGDEKMVDVEDGVEQADALLDGEHWEEAQVHGGGLPEPSRWSLII